MGIMPKSNRLPERPKPPSWEAVSEDISNIPVQVGTDDDVVLKVGKLNAPLSSYESIPSLDKSRESQDYDPDASDVMNSHEIESSYKDVLRLIRLYSELKEAPAKLEEHYSHLKSMGQELTQSMLNLRELAQSVSKDAHEAKLSLESEPLSQGSVTRSNTSHVPEGSNPVRTKSKQKKKK